MGTEELKVLIDAASSAGEGAFWLVVGYYILGVVKLLIVSAVLVYLSGLVVKLWLDTACLKRVAELLGVSYWDMNSPVREEILDCLKVLKEKSAKK